MNKKSWFQGKHHHLPSGKKIRAPYDWMPWILIIFTLIFGFFFQAIILSYFDRVSFALFFSRLPNFFTILNLMLSEVDWDYWDVVYLSFVETIKMAIAGTLLGALFALPVAFLSSRNLIRSSWITHSMKVFLSIIRTVPTLVIALIFAFIFGFGTFVGTLALVIFTFCIMTKLLYEQIETLDLGAFEAVESMGATSTQAFMVAILPQILGYYFSSILYNFEINIRSSAILGFVGAGGIGILLNDAMGLRDYAKVSLMVFALLILVIVIEQISRHLRKGLNA